MKICIVKTIALKLNKRLKRLFEIMAEISTQDKILDSSEELFAEHGIAEVSLRKIIAKAGVNIASVHYHFGSKDELIRAVFKRRLNAVNTARLQQLAKLKEDYGSKSIPLDDLLRAFLGPPLKLGREQGRNFFRLIARAHAETNSVVQEVMFAELQEVIEVFLKEFGRSSPGLDPEERAMRLAFVAGSMVQAILLPLKPLFVENFFKGATSEDQVLEMLVTFCRGGLEA